MLGELFNFRLLDQNSFFDTLYLLINYGHATRWPTHTTPDEGDEPSLADTARWNAERIRRPRGPIFGGCNEVDAPQFHPEMYFDKDPPHECFRIRLVCQLLDQSAEFLKKPNLSTRLCRFWMYFERYLLFKSYVPMEVEFIVDDTYDNLGSPVAERPRSYTEVCQRLIPFEHQQIYHRHDETEMYATFEDEEEDVGEEYDMSEEEDDDDDSGEDENEEDGEDDEDEDEDDEDGEESGKKRKRSSSSTAKEPKEKKSTPKKAKKIPKRDPAAPKKVSLAYHLFTQDMRTEIKEKQPDLSFAEMNKLLGVRWAEASAEVKEKYGKLQEKDQERYDNEMKDYTPAEGYNKSGKLITETKPKASKKEDDGTEKKVKKKKDPNAPKSAKNSYSYFVKEQGAKIKEEQPELSFGDRNKLLGSKWKELSAEDKEKYEALAKDDKARYDKEMSTYHPPKEIKTEAAPEKTKPVKTKVKKEVKEEKKREATDGNESSSSSGSSSSGSGSSSSGSSSSGSASDSEDESKPSEKKKVKSRSSASSKGRKK
mmetsp:Transcript_20304/g.44006  ORF Transcript_20304/g.44006 Transcript_20304/m.44006 type:complete len:539 (-) Transcript_20304:34-1650(-)